MANGYFEKGNVSNLISFGLLGVGLFARMEGVVGGGVVWFCGGGDELVGGEDVV